MNTVATHYWLADTKINKANRAVMKIVGSTIRHRDVAVRGKQGSMHDSSSVD